MFAHLAGSTVLYSSFNNKNASKGKIIPAKTTRDVVSGFNASPWQIATQH